MKTEKQIINELREFVYSKPKSYTNLLRTDKYKWLLDFIYDHKPLKLRTNRLSEIIYWIINGMEDYNKCPSCGKDIELFRSVFGDYAKHCSQYCSAHDMTKFSDYLKIQTAEQKRVRYEKMSNSHKMRSEEAKKKSIEKSRMTRLKKYGDSNYVNREKMEKTSIEKYGCKSPMQSDEIKKKIKEGNAHRYYNRVFVGNDFLKPMFSEDSFVEHHINGDYLTFPFKWKCLKCGMEFTSPLNGNWYTKGIGRCYARCLMCFPILNEYLHSRMELECAKYISSIEGDCNVIFGEDKRLSNLIPRYNIDIYVPNKKIAFEFNGLRWHNVNQLYRGYHLKKTEFCENAGIKLFHIWEDEWTMDNTKCKICIHNFLNDVYDIDLNNDSIEVDRAKYNKCCTINGFEFYGILPPSIMSRTNENGIVYDIEDCGKLLYKRVV